MQIGATVLLILAVLARTLAAPQDAQRLWDDGQRLEAIDTLARTLGARGDQAEVRKQLVLWELAVRRYARAIEHAAPLGDACKELRAQAHYHLGEYERALEGLSEEILDQAVMRIDALEALGRPTESGAALDRALARFESADARLLAMQGRRHLRERRAKEAAVAFRSALEIDAWDREALHGLGRALLQDGQRDAALAAMARHRKLTPLLDQREFALRGLDLAPHHAPNLAALGDAERALGRIDAAARAYEEATRRAFGDEVVPIALRHARLVEEDRRDVEAAAQILERATERTPHARLFVRLGDLRAGGGRWSEAFAFYERALAQRPDDVEVRARCDRARAEIESMNKPDAPR